MRKFRALGVLSKVEQASLRTYFLDARADMRAQTAQNASMSGGRAGANLEYGGNLVYTQKFFVASFPGIYEATWRKLTEGAHTFLVACACVFFQDAKGGVNGKHVQDDRGCRCDFCAECAPHQERPQIGTTFTNWKGEIEEGGWAGNKAPWGCLWMKVWESNVEVLAASDQRAVVVHQVAEEVDGKTGKPMGLGNAQRGEVQFLTDRGIPFYLYSVAEYEELVKLALQQGDVPECRRGVFSIKDGLRFAGQQRPTTPTPTTPNAAAPRRELGSDRHTTWSNLNFQEATEERLRTPDEEQLRPTALDRVRSALSPRSRARAYSPVPRIQGTPSALP